MPIAADAREESCLHQDVGAQGRPPGLRLGHWRYFGELERAKVIRAAYSARLDDQIAQVRTCREMSSS